MRDPRDKFKPIDEVQAAAGIKIASPELRWSSYLELLFIHLPNSEDS